jgi:plastocyanin
LAKTSLPAPMKRSLLASAKTSLPAPINGALVGIALVCSALPLLAGCGSSGSHAANPPASPTTASTGLRPDTTPKFASPSPSAPVQSGVVNISYRNIAIAPDTVRVKAGSTIKWTNYDPIPHNVTSEGGVARFASKNFGEGGTFEITVAKPGIIHYENTLQPATMNGTIEVVQ